MSKTASRGTLHNSQFLYKALKVGMAAITGTLPYVFVTKIKEKEFLLQT
jgi:hypothetical protein